MQRLGGATFEPREKRTGGAGGAVSDPATAAAAFRSVQIRFGDNSDGRRKRN